MYQPLSLPMESRQFVCSEILTCHLSVHSKADRLSVKQHRSYSLHHETTSCSLPNNELSQIMSVLTDMSVKFAN